MQLPTEAAAAAGANIFIPSSKATGTAEQSGAARWLASHPDDAPHDDSESLPKSESPLHLLGLPHHALQCPSTTWRLTQRNLLRSVCPKYRNPPASLVRLGHARVCLSVLRDSSVASYLLDSQLLPWAACLQLRCQCLGLPVCSCNRVSVSVRGRLLVVHVFCHLPVWRAAVAAVTPAATRRLTAGPAAAAAMQCCQSPRTACCQSPQTAGRVRWWATPAAPGHHCRCRCAVDEEAPSAPAAVGRCHHGCREAGQTPATSAAGAARCLASCRRRRCAPTATRRRRRSPGWWGMPPGGAGTPPVWTVRCAAAPCPAAGACLPGATAAAATQARFHTRPGPALPCPRAPAARGSQG